MNLTDLLQNQLGLENQGFQQGGFVQTSPSSTTNDLFSALDDIQGPSATRTAASTLLEEKRKLKEKLDVIQSTNFTIPREDNSLAPLMQQVSDNVTSFDFAKHTRKGKGKSATVYQPSKKSMKMKEKGEAYQDRLKEKTMKQKLKGKLRK